jgi:REP element-mobilizing transposase RayT
MSLFGTISQEKMELNEAGKMLVAVWTDLGQRFKRVSIDDLIVMPNHLHGILILEGVCRGDPGDRPLTLNQDRGEHKVRPYEDDISDIFRPTRPRGTAPHSLGRVIQAFKSITTNSYAHGVRHLAWKPFQGKLWQRNYHEHIIRNEDSLNRIRRYIRSNPAMWARDPENPDRSSFRNEVGLILS